MSAGHVVLVVEDNPSNAGTLCDIVCSMNMDVRVVATLAEVRAIIESGFRPCAVLQDMQIPHSAGARPHEKAGESSIAIIKAAWGAVPIVVVTAFRSDPEYVWAMAELDVDGFCAKSNIQALPEKILVAMRKAGREEHASCGARSEGVVASEALAQASAKAPAPKKKAGDEARVAGRVTLAMEGEPVRGRTTVRICGERREMPDTKFAVLLRCVLAHERAVGSWSDRYELGIGDDRSMATRVRDAFKGVVPEGFVVIEADRRKQFRLNPEIVVDTVSWERLGKHPDPTVRKIAMQAAKGEAREAER